MTDGIYDLTAYAETLAQESRERELDRRLGDVAAEFSGEFMQLLGLPFADQIPDAVLRLAGDLAVAAAATGRTVRGSIRGCEVNVEPVAVAAWKAVTP